MSDGLVDSSNSMNDVELKAKLNEEEGKHLLKDEKNEENSEKIDEKINLSKVSSQRTSNIEHRRFFLANELKPEEEKVEVFIDPEDIFIQEIEDAFKAITDPIRTVRGKKIGNLQGMVPLIVMPWQISQYFARDSLSRIGKMGKIRLAPL